MTFVCYGICRSRRGRCRLTRDRTYIDWVRAQQLELDYSAISHPVLGDRRRSLHGRRAEVRGFFRETAQEGVVGLVEHGARLEGWVTGYQKGKIRNGGGGSRLYTNMKCAFIIT